MTSMGVFVFVSAVGRSARRAGSSSGVVPFETLLAAEREVVCYWPSTQSYFGQPFFLRLR